MKKLCLTFSFIALALVLSAQVPGYMGKRMSFGYAGGFSPAVMQVNSKMKVSDFFLFGGTEYSDKKYASMALNYTHTFNFNWVYSREGSLLGSLNIMKSGCYFPEYQGNYYDNTNPYYSYSQDYRVSDTTTEISGFGIVVGMKNYSHELAPLGFYWSIKAGLNIYTSEAPSLKEIKSTTYNTAYGYYTETRGIIEMNKMTNKNLRLIYGLGKQLMIADKVIYDMGMDMDLIGLYRGFLSERDKNNSSSTMQTLGQDYNSNNIRLIKQRTAWRDVFSLYFGFYYML